MTFKNKKFHKPESWQYNNFTNRSGSSIRYGFVLPERESRGTVVFTGGYGRNIEFYYEAINNWRERGFTVYAMDWDGQGGSINPDKKPLGKDFEYQADTFDEFITNIVRPDRTKPSFLVSHSKGGNVVLRYMHKFQRKADFPFTASILAAPMAGIKTHFIPKSAFKKAVELLDKWGYSHLTLPAIPRITQHFKKASLGRNPTLNDIERQKAYEQREKDISDSAIDQPTVGWLSRAFRSIAHIKDKEFLKEIRLPTLILTPMIENLIEVKPQREIAAALTHGEHEEFPDAHHGVWSERDEIQEKLWARIDRFVTTQERAFHRKRTAFLVSRKPLKPIK